MCDNKGEYLAEAIEDNSGTAASQLVCDCLESAFGAVRRWRWAPGEVALPWRGRGALPEGLHQLCRGDRHLQVLPAHAVGKEVPVYKLWLRSRKRLEAG